MKISFRLQKIKWQNITTQLSNTEHNRNTWLIGKRTIFFNFWFSIEFSPNSNGPNIQSQNSVQLKFQSLEIYVNAIWLKKRTFHISKINEYCSFGIKRQWNVCLFRWYNNTSKNFNRTLTQKFQFLIDLETRI